jgi:4-hydroxy-2-oxoglutarate aldolase
VILPPIPTPFDGKGRLDTGAFQELALVLEPLVDGLLIYGSNGEGVHLTPEERRLGLQALKPRKPFLVGLMEETLPQAERALEEAQEAGAFALLATPPRYYHASLGEGLLRYYEALAERMPLFLYHVPQNTRVDLPLSAVAALGQHPKILGIKDSSGRCTGSPSTRPA